MQIILIISFALFVIGSFLPIGLVVWDVWSMRRRGRKLRFSLRAMFLAMAWFALLCALTTQYGLSADVLVIGGAVIGGILAALQLIYFAFADVFPRSKAAPLEEGANVEIGPSSTSQEIESKKPRGKWAKMPRRKWGHYGLWK